MNRAFYRLSWIVILIAISMVLSYLFYGFAPAERWIEYDRIETVKSVYRLNESPLMISYNDIKRDVNVSYLDTMRCKLDSSNYSGFGSFADDYAKGIILKEDRGEDFEPSPWVFNTSTPLPEPAECYIEANIVLHLPFGIDKFQRVDSEHFRFE